MRKGVPLAKQLCPWFCHGKVSMSLLLTCHCGKRLRVADESAGKKVRCPECGQVLFAPRRAEPEEVPEVLPVRKPRSVEDDTPPEVLPVVRPAPRAADPSAPLPVVQPVPPEQPRPPAYAVVELKPTDRRRRDERWRLELADEEVRLLDDRRRLVMRFGREEANLRFVFPSFWLSTKSLQITDGVKAQFDFSPDKPVLKEIRHYLDAVLRQDPEARRKYKRRGLTMLLFGLGILLISGAAVGFLLATGWYATRSFRGIGLSLASVVFGMVLTCIGLGMYLKAVHIDRE
jgi:hypothetical protein